MPANFTTFPHFTVSSAMNLPNSAGEPATMVSPKSASLVFTLAAASPALISLLSLSIISNEVSFGAERPNQDSTRNQVATGSPCTLHVGYQ